VRCRFTEKQKDWLDEVAKRSQVESQVAELEEAVGAKEEDVQKLIDEVG
jgi:hypothetical protein